MAFAIALFSAAVLFGTPLSIAYRQRFHITGNFLCDNRPTSNVVVRLYEHNQILPDELFKEVTSNNSGHFRIDFDTDEVSSVHPLKAYIYLKIKSDCIDIYDPDCRAEEERYTFMSPYASYSDYWPPWRDDDAMYDESDGVSTRRLHAANVELRNSQQCYLKMSEYQSKSTGEMRVAQNPRETRLN